MRLAVDSARPGASIVLAYGIPTVVFLLPLLVWPGLARPFSSPKLLAWIVVTALFGVVLLAGRRGCTGQIPGAAVISLSLLVACVGISAGLAAGANVESLFLVLTGLAWFALLVNAQWSAHRVSMALVAAASVIAVVSLLQLAGADPFHLAGWFGVGGANARMRVYATLGNPNFVGAFLAGALPVTIAMALHASRARRILVAVALAQGMAITATGSRAAALGALFGCGLVLARMTSSRRWLGLALCLFVTLLAFGLSNARPLPETIQGRLFVWRVALPHAASIPIFGFGPGAFEEQFHQWQLEYFRADHPSVDRRFAGPLDHAHNDFLEWTVEYGWAGIGALAGCLCVIAFHPRRHGGSSPVSGAAFAGACALALIALVDFPFHRPEGLFLMATLMAMATTGSEMQSSTTKDRSPGESPQGETA